MTFFEGLMLAVLAVNTWVLSEVAADVDLIRFKQENK